VFCHLCRLRCSVTEAGKQLDRERKTCKRCLYTIEDKTNARLEKQEQELKEMRARVIELEQTLQELMAMIRECPTKTSTHETTS
jgi:hypothetical protein